MKKLLSKQELRDLCAEIQAETGIQDTEWKHRFGGDKGLYGLIEEQKIAHADMVIGEDDLPPETDHECYESYCETCISLDRDKLRNEQRQRNHL